MRGFLNLFSKKHPFRPQPNQPLELEWRESGLPECILYVGVVEVQRRKLVVQASRELPLNLGPGSKLRVCSLSPPWFQSYNANLLQVSGNRLELSLPNQDELENHQVPQFEEAQKVDFATPADYQASRSPYKQTAEVVAVGRKGLTLQTKVSIPSQTQLDIQLKLPDRSDPLPAQVKAVASINLTESKKYATEVEFVAIPEPELQALWDVALRHHLRVTTRGEQP